MRRVQYVCKCCVTFPRPDQRGWDLARDIDAQSHTDTRPHTTMIHDAKKMQKFLQAKLTDAPDVPRPVYGASRTIASEQKCHSQQK